ncbi:MAG: type III-B CRISPR module RAMP protein Cmr6 [Rubrobacteraceae bacterium]
MRPLYSEAAEQSINWNGGNTGLWYDKFFDRWQKDGSIRDGDKQAWIETVKGKCGNGDLLQQAKQRMQRLLESAGGQPLFYELESDFVTGLGRQHPVENGFAWHHTLGTPYLPGSSVKGIVRACAEQWEDPKPDNADIKRIFGSESKQDEDSHVGSVIFLDAIPTGPVQLKADIMTPHYNPYYKGEAPPADWHSPNPIPFLVVEAGAGFGFGILPRSNEDEADCEVARGWLEEALEWTGAGAKTAVGYGRFAEDVEARQRAEKEREQERARRQEREEEEHRQREIEEQTQDKSGLYAEMFRASIEGNWREDKNAFSQSGVIEGWLGRLESDPQHDAINLFHGLMRRHYGDVLDNPDAKKGKKGKPRHKDRPRNFAKRMLKLLEETQ